MAWKQITVDDLRKYLAEPEITKLDTLVNDNEQTTILLDTIRMVSQAWRGALSTNHVIDTRQYYIPDEYEIYILAHIRYEVWTRIPNSGAIGLDERRMKAYDRAMEMFDAVSIATELPDPPYRPAGYDAPRIIMPCQRILSSCSGATATGNCVDCE